MRSDYELSDTAPAYLDDVGDILIRTFERPMGDDPSVTHVVLDLSKCSPIEASVHLKVEGHGMDDLGLLELELEILARDTEAAAANNLFRHMQTVYDERDSSVEDSVAAEEVTKEDNEEPLRLSKDIEEIDRIGVCPAPLMDA